jgi:predicted nucleotidyltransferase
MIHLEPRHRVMVEKILSCYPYAFYAFGSRVKGTHKPFSDLDLCTPDDLSVQEMGRLITEFIESDPPFTVDIVRMRSITPSFRERIEAEMEFLYQRAQSAA